MTTQVNGVPKRAVRPQRVLVTGGSGFIGRRVVHALLDDGAEVTVADKRAFPDGEHADELRTIIGDLRDPSVAAQAGMFAAWRAGFSGPLILGTGESVAVNDIVGAARSVTGRDIPVQHIAPKPGEMPAVIVDISAARALGYAPAHDLKSGLSTVWPEFWEAEK